MWIRPFSILLGLWLWLYWSVGILATPTQTAEDATTPTQVSKDGASPTLIVGEDDAWFTEFLEDSGDLTDLIDSPDTVSSDNTVFHDLDVGPICQNEVLPGLEELLGNIPDFDDLEASLNHIVPVSPEATVESVALLPQGQGMAYDDVIDLSLPIPDYMDPLAAIDCFANRPSQGWPAGRNREMYTDLRTLCSFLGRFFDGHSGNMGCACRRSAGDTANIRCYPALADPIFSGSAYLRRYCASNCECRKYPKEIPNYKGNYPVDLTKPPVSSCAVIQAYLAMHSSSTYSSGPPSKKSKPSPPDFHGNTRSNRQKERYCRVGCSRNDFSCGMRSSGCACELSTVGAGLWIPFRCRPRSAPEMVAIGMSSLAAAAAGGGKRKRDSERGPVCACNGTYVSEGCCHSLDGLIWEHPDLWLGQIAPSSEDLLLLKEKS